MSSDLLLLSLGLILLLGLVADYLGRHSLLPRVTILLILGIILGNDGLSIIPQGLVDNFQLIADITLLMVGFLLGGQITKELFVNHGQVIFWISFSAAFIAIILVITGLTVLGVELELAILLGCISAATAPAATVDVVMEQRSRSYFSKILLSIVAIDDAWGLIFFSIGLSVVSFMSYEAHQSEGLYFLLKDLGGAIILGGAIGFPAAYITGRIRPGRPMLTEALGLVLFAGGLALYFDVSYLITAIVMGALIRNFAFHHEYAFHEIENVEWPFLVVFFMLAGASLEFGAVSSVLYIGIAYIFLRILGKVAGSWLGGMLSNAPPPIRQWMGLALLPQAGVAIGMALVASSRFPQYEDALISLVVLSTIFFELIGPALTRWAIIQADTRL